MPALPGSAPARRWRWVEQGPNDEAVMQETTDDEILRAYYPHWRRAMLKAGKAAEIRERACIEDFVVVHWAEEVT